MAKVSKDMDFLICKGCGKLFDEDLFYNMGSGKFLPLCKDCCESLIVDKDGILDIYNFNELLKRLDKVFISKFWLKAGMLGKPYFGNYIQMLKENGMKNKKYKDSDPIEIKNNTPKPEEIIEEKKEEEILEQNELTEKWGITNAEDIDFLEKEYHEWATSYEIDSKAMVDSVKQLCLVELDIRKSRKKNDVQSLDKLLRIKSQILGDANLKPVQETGNAANEQVSIGMLIKKFEQEEPIPEDTIPDWIDEMKVWIVGQLARMEGLQSEVTDDFNKELSKYGIDIDKELDEKLGDE